MNRFNHSLRLLVIPLVLAIVAVISACGPGGGYATYKNSKYGIEFQYPTTWTEYDGSKLPKDSPPDEVVALGLQDSSSNALGAVTILVDDLSDKTTTLQDYTDSAIQELENGYSDFKMIDSSSLTLSGNPAHSVVFTEDTTDSSGNQSQATDEVEEVWTLVNQKSYVITYLIDQSDFQTFQPDVQKCLDSMKIQSASATPAQKGSTGSKSANITLKRIATVKPPSGWIKSVAATNSYFISAVDGNTYTKYDITTDKELGQVTINPLAPPGYDTLDHDNADIALTPDGKYLLIADYLSKRVDVADPASGQTLGSISVDTPVQFEPYISGLVPVDSYQGVVLIDPAQQKGTDTDQTAFSSDGKWTYKVQSPASSGGDYQLVITQTQTNQVTTADLGKVDGLNGGMSVCASPDGQRIYVLVSGHRIMVFDNTGKQINIIGLPLEPDYQNMSISPDGTILAIWAQSKGAVSSQPAANPGYSINQFIQVSGAVELLNSQTLKPLNVDLSDLTGPHHVIFSPDSAYVLIADQFSGVVVIRDLSVPGMAGQTAPEDTGSPVKTTVPASPAASPSLSADYLTYKNSTYGFQFQYPAAWTIYDGNNLPQGTPQGVVVDISMPDSSGNVIGHADIVIDDLSGSNMTLQDFSTEAMSEAKQGATNFNLIDSGATTLAGNPAGGMVYTEDLAGGQGQETVEIVQVWTLVNQKAYIATFLSDENQYDAQADSVQQWMDSIKITSTANNSGGYQPPSTSGTYQPPTTDGTFQLPTTDGTFQLPGTDGTFQPPTTSGTFQP